MLRIISENGDWNIIVDGIEYNFYYSNSKPIEGLILNGCDTQENEYQIDNYKFTATKEECIYSESGYRYILNINTQG